MRMRALIAACMLALAVGQADAAEPPFAVIASPDLAPAALSRETLALIYRRRQLFWADGVRAQPANLPANDSLRRAFSRCVLGQTPEQTEDYWREMYFHGVVPPRVLASEQAMRLFVASARGAIAYVGTCPPGGGYVVLLTFGSVPDCPSHPASCVALQE